MNRCLAARAGLVALVALTGPAARAEQPSEAEPAPAEPSEVDADDSERGESTATPPQSDNSAALTTGLWREPEIPIDLAWHILALPETAIELVFSPLAFTVSVIEKYRVDQRVYDLLRNDAGTIKVSPNAKFSGSDGFGIGADLVFDNYFYRGEELRGGGLIRLNGDWELGTRFRRRFPGLEGREIELEWLAERDQNYKYYGIGNDSAVGDERILLQQSALVLLAFDMFSRETLERYGRVTLGYRRTGLSPGIDATNQPLDPMDPDVEVPPDFGDTNNYAVAGFDIAYDTRDTIGRPSRGVLAQFHSQASTSFEGTSLGSLALGTDVSWFFSLLPRHRVLVLQAGLAGVMPIAPDGQIPLTDLILLDRRQHLRGYATGRFRDRIGWWTSAEYRYPIYEYKDTGVALSPMIFADAGRVGSSVRDLASGPIRWDVGLGLRGEHESKLIMQIEWGFSPEGNEIGFSIGKDL